MTTDSTPTPAEPLTEKQIDAMCFNTPPGWRCTRHAGHSGPCAAVESPEEIECVARGMDRLREAATPAAAETAQPAAPEPRAWHFDGVPPAGSTCLLWVKPSYAKEPSYALDGYGEQREAPATWSSVTTPIGDGWDSWEHEEVIAWLLLDEAGPVATQAQPATHAEVLTDELLTDRELQSLRNMGNEAERAADEIVSLRAAIATQAAQTKQPKDVGDASGPGGHGQGRRGCGMSTEDPWRDAVDAALVSAGLDCLAPDADPAPQVVEPIPMLLHCPKCGTQHVDAPEDADCDGDVVHSFGWGNPPHRSHLCHHCGCIWRPADVPTTGVKAIATKGKADTWDQAFADSVDAQLRAPQASAPSVQPTDDRLRAMFEELAGSCRRAAERRWFMRGYRLAQASALPAAQQPAVEPVAWVRFCSDDTYEGPIMDCDSRMTEVRKKSGAWTPLYASPTAQPAPDVVADARRWQPIETAPRDGTEFLGFRRGQIATSHRVPRDDCEMWVFGELSAAFEVWPEACPTHWMPLPPPPAIDAELPAEGKGLRHD